MCNNLVCEVCGGLGVNQRHFHPYHVTLCNAHFNELHCEHQKKNPRKAMVEFHSASQLRNTYFGIDEGIENKKDFVFVLKKRLGAWIDAEHEYFLMAERIVKGMKKEWDKKYKKKKILRPVLNCRKCGLGITCTCLEPLYDSP